MDRRAFLRGSALIASGLIAADQLELLERLTHVRKSFAVNGLVRRYDLWTDGYRFGWVQEARIGSLPPPAHRYVRVGYVIVDSRGSAIEWTDYRPPTARVLVEGMLITRVGGPPPLSW